MKARGCTASSPQRGFLRSALSLRTLHLIGVASIANVDMGHSIFVWVEPASVAPRVVVVVVGAVVVVVLVFFSLVVSTVSIWWCCDSP